MIIHVFNANSYHLVPTITKSFATIYKDFGTKIILFGNKDLDKKLYIEHFDSINFKNYSFCTSKLEFISILKKNKKDPILFHAGSYSWFLLAILYGRKNINWVCWGSGASLKTSLRSKLAAPMKSFIYHHFNSIVVLMKEDGDTIVEDFHVNKKKIFVLSYAPKDINKYQDLFLQLLNENIGTKKVKPLILLGNNSHNIDGYIYMLDLLRIYTGKIQIQCMLHYSLIKDKKYYELITLGHALFGNDFNSNEEFYKYNDYIYYMNKCDIYICNSKNQTGLGAIYTCLCLGKKVYITGKNYDWVTSLGASIHNVNKIDKNLSFEDFTSEVPFPDKLENNRCIMSFRNESPEKWINYLDLLDKNIAI